MSLDDAARPRVAVFDLADPTREPIHELQLPLEMHDGEPAGAPRGLALDGCKLHVATANGYVHTFNVEMPCSSGGSASGVGTSDGGASASGTTPATNAANKQVARPEETLAALAKVAPQLGSAPAPAAVAPAAPAPAAPAPAAHAPVEPTPVAPAPAPSEPTPAPTLAPAEPVAPAPVAPAPARATLAPASASAPAPAQPASPSAPSIATVDKTALVAATAEEQAADAAMGETQHELEKSHSERCKSYWRYIVSLAQEAEARTRHNQAVAAHGAAQSKRAREQEAVEEAEKLEIKRQKKERKIAARKAVEAAEAAEAAVEAAEAAAKAAAAKAAKAAEARERAKLEAERAQAVIDLDSDSE